MINSPELPLGECYLEFPDGISVLATGFKHATGFDIIRALPEYENQMLSIRYQLSLLNA